MRARNRTGKLILNRNEVTLSYHHAKHSEQESNLRPSRSKRDTLSSELPERKNYIMNTDALQNEIIVIGHHVEDIEKGLDQGDIDYAKKGLHDIKEALGRLSQFVKPEQRSEIDRIADLMPDEL